MLLHYLVKCSQRIVHVKPLTFYAKKHQTLFRRTCGSQTAQIRIQSITRPGLSCTVVSILDKNTQLGWLGWRVIDVWCGLEQSTIDMAIDHCHRRLRACIRSKGGQFEHNLWTDDINFVNICHLQCNFCVTVTMLHLSLKNCVPSTSRMPTPVFVLQGSAAVE